MFKKITKHALTLTVAAYFALLSLLGAGDRLYPNTVSCPDEGEVPSSLLFSLESNKETGRGRVMALGVFPVKEVSVCFYSPKELIPVGELFGVRMKSEGLIVTRLGEVKTDQGEKSPAKEAGLKKGDLLLKANGKSLKTASDLAEHVAKAEGRPITLTVKRGDGLLTLSLTPVRRSGGPYQAGVWVRDGAAGMGTITFQDPASGAFGGLGHGICDGETGLLFPLSEGEVCDAYLEEVKKGADGDPGELRGHLGGKTGRLTANSACGVFGELNETCRGKAVPVGKKEDLQTGKAILLCCLSDEGAKEYEIAIEEIFSADRSTKNFLVHITDPALLAQTGGIVQGMSGSPILQNGKLVGAVTHVLVSDPTRGYGIFIENMLSAADVPQAKAS